MYSAPFTRTVFICKQIDSQNNLWAQHRGQQSFSHCLCQRSSNSTVNKSDNLNVFLKKISDKYNINLIILGDFNDLF